MDKKIVDMFPLAEPIMKIGQNSRKFWPVYMITNKGQYLNKNLQSFVAYVRDTDVA